MYSTASHSGSSRKDRRSLGGIAGVATGSAIALLVFLASCSMLVGPVLDEGLDCDDAESGGASGTEESPDASLDQFLSPGPGWAVVLGFYTGSADSTASLKANHAALSAVSADAFSIDAAGRVRGAVPKAMLSYLKARRLPVYACISNWSESAGGFDRNLVHAILTRPASRKKAIADLRSLVKCSRYSGINIDFENIPVSDRVALTNFVRDLASAIRVHGAKVLVSVPAKKSDDPSDSWSGAFDYAGLARYAAALQVMTYDQNGSWGTSPGPVAGLEWMRASLQYAVSAVPSAKILMGLPAYGYDWNLTKNDPAFNAMVAWKDIPALLARTGAVPQWDAASCSPYFSYAAEDGSLHEVWYENQRSVEEKTRFVSSLKLRGVSAWALGLDDSSFWTAVKKGLT
jgi:spore germination protein YaaH